MIIETIPLGIYATNCYIFGDNLSREVVIIDPADEANKIINIIEKNNYIVKYIIITHGHFDHILALKDIKQQYNAKVAIHKGDADYLSNNTANLSTAMPNIKLESVRADIILNDGDILNLGKYKLEIIHTPGHTNGGICIKADDVLFSGDTLFYNSIGRTDFPTGSFDKIEASIKKLYTFAGSTKVYPGHGQSTTIGHEKQTNPFVRCIV